MRKAIPIFVAATLLASTTVPAFAADQSQKDECLIASRNCVDQVDDIYKRIHRLNREIKKGKRVYTRQELAELHQKLSETQDLLKTLEKPGK